MVLTDLLARAAVVTIITPLVGGLIKLFLMSADDGVLTDADIARFLLHPFGLAALLVVGSVSLAVRFAESGSLMVVGYGALEDRRVTWLDAVRYSASHAGALLRLGGALLVRVLPVVLAFLAAVGGVYLLLLGRHDINYYLAYRPPEFLWAATLAGLVLLGLAVVLLRLFSGWILGLPLTLFEGIGGGEALRESARRTRGVAWGIVLWVVAWLALEWLLAIAAAFLIGRIGGLLVPGLDGENFVLVASGLALTLALSGLVNLAVQVFAVSFFPLVLVRLYRSLGGAGRLDPRPAERGSLAERPSFRVPGRRLLLASGVVVVAVSAMGYLALREFDAADDVIVIAHRGASAAAPENTLAAFEEAIAQSTDWIELDVQENADGVVIVAHDSDFMKVAGVGVKVWNATTEQLRQIDIGSRFAPEFSAERTPTLRQALELARGRAGVVIELKYYGHRQRLESRVAEVVEATGMQSDVMIMSLEREGLARFATLRPDWSRGLLNTASVGNLTRLDVDFLALNATAATRSMIRRAHGRGKKVFVWTVNDPLRMSVMISRGVDGLITDEPGAARRVLELREGLTAFGRLVVWIAGESGLLRVREEASTVEDA